MLGQYEIKGPISKDIMDQNTAQRPKKKENFFKKNYKKKVWVNWIISGDPQSPRSVDLGFRFLGQLVSYFIKNMQAAASSRRFATFYMGEKN